MSDIATESIPMAYAPTGSLIPIVEGPGRVIVGNARFTIITPNCIRMEYSDCCTFLDAQTLFAYKRDTRMADALICCNGQKLTIDTGCLRLIYLVDGQPFNADNLTICVKKGDDEVVWQPGMKNEKNLGGALSTVDNINGPVPLPDGLLACDGWSVVDDTAKPVFTDGWIAQAPLHKRPDVDWYFFGYGFDYKAALTSLAAISGAVPMPRKHVHGSWYCRWFCYTEEDFRQIVEEYRQHDFPLDIMVMDMDWHTKDGTVGFGHAGTLGWTGYTWNTDLLPHHDELLREFREDGIFVTVNDHPCDGVRDHETCYEDFIQLLGIKPGENPPYNAGNRSYMEAVFQAAHAPLEARGIDFWWVDWQQDYIYPSVYGVPGLKHLPWLNYLYFQHSERNGRRGQGFSRWGGWGDQRHPIQFSGDCGCTWPMLAFEVTLTAVSGNMGCFYWAHDIGGFWGERNPEMYTRWAQFGAFSSSLRLHSCGDDLDRRPWLWGEPFVEAMRKAFHLRSELFPYIYSSVRQCYEQTIPLLRPMYLEYPEQEEAYAYPEQYLFGDHLLVAPIVTPGKGKEMLACKEVWFPAGIWYHLLTGERIIGDSLHTVSAAITTIPVYIRAGVPLPMQPYTARMTTTPLDTLIVRCYPGETGESVLYEDDGQSIGYQQGQHAMTRLRYSNQNTTVTIFIDAVEGTFDGQNSARAYRVELAATNPASIAFVNGQPVNVEYDHAKSMNIIFIPTCAITTAIEVVVSCTSKN